MRRPFAILLVVLAGGSACRRPPEIYAPPPQRAALTESPPDGPGYFLSMDRPEAGRYLVQDFQDHGPGTWRWAYAHPVMRFYVPEAPQLKFAMDFSIPERTFRDTGPVTLAIRINGKAFDSPRFETPGELHYVRAVPASLLRPRDYNLVAIDPSPVWVSKTDGGKLGFILSRAGFID